MKFGQASRCCVQGSYRQHRTWCRLQCMSAALHCSAAKQAATDQWACHQHPLSAHSKKLSKRADNTKVCKHTKLCQARASIFNSHTNTVAKLYQQRYAQLLQLWYPHNVTSGGKVTHKRCTNGMHLSWLPKARIVGWCQHPECHLRLMIKLVCGRCCRMDQRD